MRHPALNTRPPPPPRRRHWRARAWTIAFIAPLLPPLACADPSPAPEDKPVLSLRCAQGQQPSLSYTHEQLRQLPQKTIQTSLPAGLGGLGKLNWLGVSLKTLMQQSHCEGRQMKVLALNAYSDTIPTQDMEAYDPILAYARDGQAISVRDKGPLIVIYPFDEYPKLNSQVYFNRTVWQVYAIEIR